jgi:excisionase family DNA binding protein
MAKMQFSGLMNIRESAAALGCSVATLRSWVWKEQIEKVRVGRAIRFRPEVIQQIIDNGTIPPRAS